MSTKRPQAFYEEMVDAINDLFGAHPGHRAAHAKGIYVSGHFTPTEAASRLSRAAHFHRTSTPVTARFSNGSGMPAASDADPDARGLAIKFHLDDGKAMDLVAITVPAFFVRTPEDFIAFTRARRPQAETGKPDPAVIGAFVSKHPETQRAIQLAGSSPHPSSYAGATYNGIHTFFLVDAEGKRVPVRYRLQPVDAVAPVNAPDDATPDAFQEALRRRLSMGPASFDLQYVVAEAADDLLDPTVPWPSDRHWITAGRVKLDAVVPRSSGGEDTMIFDPTNVIDGIECSDDPILHARSGAYSVSYSRRTKKLS